jgi:hypothetical protein
MQVFRSRAKARSTRRLAAVIAVVSAMFIIGGLGPAPASAGHYEAQPFCPAGSTSPWHAWWVLNPGQRCVAGIRVRADGMAGLIGHWGPSYCIVGKENSDGTGGNNYPLVCGQGSQVPGIWVPPWGTTTGGAMFGPSVPGGTNPTFPTIINNSGEQEWLEGYWGGYFP